MMSDDYDYDDGDDDDEEEDFCIWVWIGLWLWFLQECFYWYVWFICATVTTIRKINVTVMWM